jgi:hypothetical protein
MAPLDRRHVEANETCAARFDRDGMKDDLE